MSIKIVTDTEVFWYNGNSEELEDDIALVGWINAQVERSGGDTVDVRLNPAHILYYQEHKK